MFVSVDIGNLDMIVVLSMEFVWQFGVIQGRLSNVRYKCWRFAVNVRPLKILLDCTRPVSLLLQRSELGKRSCCCRVRTIYLYLYP